MIRIPWVMSILFINKVFSEMEDLLISKTRTTNLEQYESFADAVVISFQVPENTIYGSFKFVASEQDLSIFGCSIRNVSVYLKYGSPPLINPDGSPFPEDFKNISRSPIYNLEFQTNHADSYINISSPDPGLFYAATFLSYTDPRYRKIAQQGLTQSCDAFVESSLHVRKVENPTIISENQLVDVIVKPNISRYFKFLVPEEMNHAILSIENMLLSETANVINLRIQARKPPTPDDFLTERVIGYSSSPIQVLFATEPQIWYYIQFDIPIDTGDTKVSEINFRLRYFSNRVPVNTFMSQTIGNTTLFNISLITKYFQSNRITDIQSYKQYNLVRESSSKSFSFSYQLEAESNNNMLVPINITSDEFSVLRFNLRKGSDIGGTLQYILAFKPRVIKKGRLLSYQDEPKENIIIGCIQRDSLSVPTWPNYCVTNNISTHSPLILNKTTTNSTVLVPYPEAGIWYASFKLFCGTCEPCNCSEACQSEYEMCTIECELNCTKTFAENCENCVENCSNSIISTEECEGCDCDGPCLKNLNTSCNSSVIFDVSSRPCYYGDCGKQGKCILMISEGTAYSTCLCSNNYRGFDCSDGSQATPYSLVLLEFLLLVISNIFFLPVTYVAFRRKYYVESLSYFSIFISSTLYHACDAGENIISYCIVKLNALQFADFFSALLAIWLTLLAMADLPSVNLSIFQMAGAIIISFCVTLNRYAFWIFALPSSIGIVIIGISWYRKYRQFKQMFIDKTYLLLKLPIGTAIVVVGLTIYGLLQKQDNYKYLHSLWHIIMASGVFFLLPKSDTFQAAALL